MYMVDADDRKPLSLASTHKELAQRRERLIAAQREARLKEERQRAQLDLAWRRLLLDEAACEFAAIEALHHAEQRDMPYLSLVGFKAMADDQRDSEPVHDTGNIWGLKRVQIEKFPPGQATVLKRIRLGEHPPGAMVVCRYHRWAIADGGLRRACTTCGLASVL
jgi:hypothetical protein